MYGIISSRCFEAVEERYGPAVCNIQDSNLQQALLQAARIQLDFLIIDIDVPGQIEEEIHQYRVQRPDTRIILLASGREPGDPVVARVVALGVYDVASENDELLDNELIRLIETPAGYVQAARWLQVGQGAAGSAGKLSQINRNSIADGKVIVQQRPLGLTTIAIAGAGQGAGASHISLAICAHLARYNTRVVLAEWPAVNGEGAEGSQYYPYAEYAGAKQGVRSEQGIDIHFAHVHGFDIFCDARSFRGIDYIFPVVARGSYEYLVLDLGELTPDKLAEMNRAALAVLVVNAAPYRIERFLPFVDKDNFTHFIPDIKRWRIALNHASNKEMKWFKSSFRGKLGEVVQLPHFPDPAGSVCGELLQKLVESVMPINVYNERNQVLQKAAEAFVRIKGSLLNLR